MATASVYKVCSHRQVSLGLDRETSVGVGRDISEGKSVKKMTGSGFGTEIQCLGHLQICIEQWRQADRLQLLLSATRNYGYAPGHFAVSIELLYVAILKRGACDPLSWTHRKKESRPVMKPSVKRAQEPASLRYANHNNDLARQKGSKEWY